MPASFSDLDGGASWHSSASSRGHASECSHSFDSQRAGDVGLDSKFSYGTSLLGCSSMDRGPCRKVCRSKPYDWPNGLTFR